MADQPTYGDRASAGDRTSADGEHPPATFVARPPGTSREDRSLLLSLVGFLSLASLIAAAFTTPGRHVLGFVLAISALVALVTLWRESAGAAIASFVVLAGLGGLISPAAESPEPRAGISERDDVAESFARALQATVCEAYAAGMSDFEIATLVATSDLSDEDADEFAHLIVAARNNC